MRNCILPALILIALLITNASRLDAQSAGRKTVQQSSLWISAAASARVHKYVGVQGEIVARLSEFRTSQQHEGQIGADIYVADGLIISPIGYDFFLNYQYGKMPAAVAQNEHRMWHQIFYVKNINRVNLGIRLRAEEIWRERKVKNDKGEYYVSDYTFKPRLRPRFHVNIALNRSSMVKPGTVFMSLWHEMYIAVGPKVAYHLPEENRVHVGFGYRASSWATVSMGYMHQLIIRADGAQAESNHTLLAQAVFTPDLRRKAP